MEAGVGFGVTGGLQPEIVRTVAAEAERLGFTTFWANDTPHGDGLATLAEAAEVTSDIRLGVGVVPLDRQDAEAILAKLENLSLPAKRLTIGVGSGGSKGGLDRVRRGCEALKAGTKARVVVGSLGPRMTELAGEVADGTLLNWLTPGQAERSAALVRETAHAAGRPEPWIYGYVRTALGAAAQQRLESEAQRYESYPAYATHFRRMGVRAVETAASAENADALRDALSAFEAVLDETVARAVTAAETLEEYLALLRAIAPRK